MLRALGALTSLALILAGGGMAGAQVIVEWNMANSEPALGQTIRAGDLIDGKTIDAGAFFESAFVDPVNNVHAFNFKYFGCLEQWDGIESTTYDPLDCFWHGYGDPGGCDPVYHMPDLTDGTGVFAPVQRDFARACLVARYDFDQPTDIGEILVFAHNEGRDVRVFQHYDVYVSYDGSLTGMTPLRLGAQTAWFGAANSQVTFPGTDAPWAWSYTHIFNCSNPVLAAGVRKIRFVFYASGIGDLMMDPWRGYWNESGPILNCQAQYPAEPGDLDGRYKPFVAPMVAEIDVLPPQPITPGDVNADTLVNLADFAAWGEAMEGPGVGPIAYAARPLDFSPRDCDVDLADFAAFQRLLVP